LEINDDAKEIVQKLGEAINAAVERSHEVAEAIESLREAGYEMELTLRLEIGLREYGRDGEGDEDADESARLELTDEDRRTLRSMKIRFDDADGEL
jgi:glycine cleavage system aminomethyltransferase T